MPPNLARMYPPVSFWNFSSAAAAAAANVATARHASAVTRSRRFFQFFLVLIEAILGRSSAWGRLLQHGLQGGTRGLVSQLHVSSGQPHLVATAARFFSGVETKLVLLDAPLAGALVTHGRDGERAVSLEHLAPMHFIRQLHPREFRLNLRTRELLEFLLSRGSWLECKHAEQRGRRCCKLFFRRVAHCAYRASMMTEAIGTHRSSSAFSGAKRRAAELRPGRQIARATLSSSRSPSCRGRRAVPWRASRRRHWPRSA